MGLFLRIVQILSLALGVGLFAALAYFDPELSKNRMAVLLGCGLFGFGCMYAVTFTVTLLLHGRKAAESIEWY